MERIWSFHGPGGLYAIWNPIEKSGLGETVSAIVWDSSNRSVTTAMESSHRGHHHCRTKHRWYPPDKSSCAPRRLCYSGISMLREQSSKLTPIHPKLRKGLSANSAFTTYQCNLPPSVAMSGAKLHSWPRSSYNNLISAVFWPLNGDYRQGSLCRGSANISER